MRWLNINRNTDARFRCFGCCHVQTGSICLGFYHLILQFMSIGFVLYFMSVDPTAFGLFDSSDYVTNKSASNYNVQQQRRAFRKLSFVTSTTVSVINYEYHKVDKKNYSVIGNVDGKVVDGANVDLGNFAVSPEPLPTPLPQTVPMSQNERNYEEGKNGMFGKLGRFKAAGNQLSLALLTGLSVITLMMIYGSMKVKPLYILPYFGYQVFDFTITSLMAVSYYSWVPNANEFLNSHPDFPFSRELSSYDLQWLGFLVLIVYIGVLIVKAYFIGVVFACYQYCQLRSQGIITFQQQANGTRTDAELLLPPSYENAVKMPAPAKVDTQESVTPPPPYQNV